MAFPCIVCEISFEKSNHLKRHETTHKHQVNLSFYNLLRRKTCSDHELQSTLPAETENNLHPCHFEDTVDEQRFVEEEEEKEDEEIIHESDDFVVGAYLILHEIPFEKSKFYTWIVIDDANCKHGV